MNIKTFWQKGIVEMTPLNQLYAKLWGVGGNIVGLGLAFFYLYLKGFWYLDIFIAFSWFLSVIEFIGVRQQYKNLKILTMEDVNYDTKNILE